MTDFVELIDGWHYEEGGQMIGPFRSRQEAEMTQREIEFLKADIKFIEAEIERRKRPGYHVFQA